MTDLKQACLVALSLVAAGCDTAPEEPVVENVEPGAVEEAPAEADWRQDLAEFKQSSEKRLAELEDDLDENVDEAREDAAQARRELGQQIDALQGRLADLGAATAEEWRDAKQEIAERLDAIDQRLNETRERPSIED